MPNGITPPRVIARECADILATMGTHIRRFEVMRDESRYNTQDRSIKTMLNDIFATELLSANSAIMHLLRRNSSDCLKKQVDYSKNS